MARRFTTQIGAIERELIRANRFADKKNLFLYCAFISCERFARIASNLRFAIFSHPQLDTQKGVQFGNPETIRENQVIFANLRMDSRDTSPSKYRANPRKKLGKPKKRESPKKAGQGQLGTDESTSGRLSSRAGSFAQIHNRTYPLFYRSAALSERWKGVCAGRGVCIRISTEK